MSKRNIAVIALLSMIALTAGCGSDYEGETADTESSTDTSSYVQPEESENVDESKVLSTVEGVDIDLTTLSSTMVYGQVYNMMFYPENFVGKTIRMQGIYSDYFDQGKGKHYFACIIMDATACCSQGIEFELTQEYTYPDEYPVDGDVCTVEGVFELYEEDGYQYCTLRNAKLIQNS